jgi:hypothetical protein
MEEDQQLNQDEITEIFSEILVIDEPKIEQPAQEKPEPAVRTPFTPPAPKRHPRNIPKFSQSRKGI